jgi:hypothetical protein
MKPSLFAFIFPTVKAICAVIGFIVTITVASLAGINQIAKVQAEVVEDRMMAVRDADFEHINGRFDRQDQQLRSILTIVKKIKR